MAVDSLFYHKIVFVPWRIVSYNIFSGSSRGPDIFGTEPWHFYIRNLLLNFNGWFLLSLCSGPLLMLRFILQWANLPRHRLVRDVGLITPFYLWLGIFSIQAHKEERFMYPVYPFMCLNAGLALHNILFALGNLPGTVAELIPASIRLSLISVLILSMSVGGVWRTVGNVTAYSAPLDIYSPLQNHPYASMTGNVCLGKEWYRFPSSYFLPEKMRARFVKSEFDGLLPGQFSEARTSFGLPPTWIVPSGMNDQNIEDVGKHVWHKVSLLLLR